MRPRRTLVALPRLGELAIAVLVIAVFPSGAARIDLATGELADRRCGWNFGLVDHAPQTRRHNRLPGRSICDLPR